MPLFGGKIKKIKKKNGCYSFANKRIFGIMYIEEIHFYMVLESCVKSCVQKIL